MILLQYQAYVLSQPLCIPLAQAHAIEGDRALLRLIKLIEQIHDGALTGTTQTDKGRNLTAGNAHGHIEERLRAIGVGKVDVAQFEVALHLSRMMLTCGFHLAIGMQNTKEALGIDECIVHIIIDAMELTDRRTHIGKEHDVIHNLTNSHAWIIDEHEIGCEDDNQYGTYLLEETLQAVEEIGFLTRGELQIGHRALNARLTISLDLLAIERLDDGDALEDV